MDNGVFRSCAAEANAFVVLRYRSCSCENSWDCSTSGAEAPAESEELCFSERDDSWMVEDKWGIVSNRAGRGGNHPAKLIAVSNARIGAARCQRKMQNICHFR